MKNKQKVILADFLVLILIVTIVFSEFWYSGIENTLFPILLLTFLFIIVFSTGMLNGIVYYEHLQKIKSLKTKYCPNCGLKATINWNSDNEIWYTCNKCNWILGWIGNN
jgi:hypothetical protein